MKLPIIGQYSVLFSIVCGWILFACFGLSNPVTPVTDIIRLPSLFVFGMPRIEWNMAITVVFVTLLLLTNMLASIRVVQKVVSKYEEDLCGESLQTSWHYNRNKSIARRSIFSHWSCCHFWIRRIYCNDKYL